ncbi:von Willebrand factor type A domain-containing protein [Falsigemmobacter intermedius]|uniref:DUF3520 domain-containing protein n=1 Tax=Falsigemmobacter intermedius TaxID=1553448 RepID=A0A444MGV5_9RHOB|nr:von Willebrand factor type A domain-containing protein [Falsigemmobacter intermedius]RWY45565.1 DUF3520 domain-containing protein [Falsigemmobacter intermedius]
MTEPRDDTERLRAALKGAAPQADAARRAEILALAMENFDATAKDQARVMRPENNRSLGGGLFSGVREMLSRLTSRGALAATSSVAVLALGVTLVTLPQQPGPEAIAVPDAPAELHGAAPAAEQAIAPVTAQSDRMALPPAPISPAPQMGGGGAAMQRMARPASGAMQSADAPQIAPSGSDRFAEFEASGVKVTAEEPVSTFSVDVDTASWSWIRRSLRGGVLPDPASVRVEEMINYFPYAYPAPAAEAEEPFSLSLSRFASPWAEGKDLVRIGLQGKLPVVAERPALNLVFLVDTSGSMEGEDRLGLLKTSLSLLLGQLSAEDQVAIVAYAGSAGEVLPPTSAAERGKILGALNNLQAGGSTAGGEGLELAYRLAGQMAGEGRIGRVLLATDGDFNVGLSDPEDLKAYVSGKRNSGIALSVLGFGRGNLDDALMQALAQNGNGQAAYIDSAEEARKVMVDQAAGALFTIAGDVKLQVEWNPAVVAEYRLIGYETRALSRVDFADDKVDAGEIGAGHQVTALYEITPVGSAARLSEPLRYGRESLGSSEEAGWLKLRYKAPGETASRLIEQAVPATASEPDADARFAAAVAGFGQLLSGGRFVDTWGYQEAVALAEGAKGEDPFGYRAAAVELMRLAAALSGK